MKFREKRLVEIKENLAILVVKREWKRRKLTVRILRKKIQRVKRIRIAKINKENFEKYLTSIGGNLNCVRKEDKGGDVAEEEGVAPGMGIAQSSDENLERSEEEKIFKESEKIQAMIQSRIRHLVEKGKLAYGIGKPRITSPVPVMEGKTIKSNRSTIQSKFLESTTSTNAKSRPASREKQAQKRTFIINSPKIKTTRFEYWHHYESLTNFSKSLNENNDNKVLKSSSGSKRYLSSTQSFAIRVKINKLHKRKEESEPVKIRNRKVRIKIKKPLECKEEDKDKEMIKKEVKRWIPVARSDCKYITGIDNQNYSPPVNATRESSKQNNTNVSLFTNVQHLGNLSVLSFIDPA